MNYYELIYLLEEFKTKLCNCWLEQAVTPFKNQLELFITNGEESFRLIFNASPGNAALFLDSYRPAKKSNTQQFFESIYGNPISEIILEENERLISFLFEDGSRLWFKLFGSKANALLAREGIIIETFKDRDSIGDEEPSPKSPKLLQSESLEGVQIALRLQKLIPILPKVWINKLDDIHHFVDMSDNELLEFARDLDTSIREKAEFRILESGEVTLIPERLLPDDSAQRVGSVNDLILHRFKNYAHQQRLKSQKNGLFKSIKRKLKRTESALKNLYQADKGLEKADKYEKFGHILMANAHQPVSRKKVIELDDLYNAGNTILIPIQMDLSLAENAQRYYSKSSNSLKSYEEALDRIPELEKTKDLYSTLLEEIEVITQMRDLNEWKKLNKDYLSGLEQASTTKETSNPFFEIEYKGYPIWIGKNARSNDVLVQKSHKEDIWLHARGVSGSHVIIRMNNSKNELDLILIEEIASFAAYQSKARGSNLVPVIYTKRKYIRKQKGAALGAVLVQKEKVVIVEPKNPFE